MAVPSRDLKRGRGPIRADSDTEADVTDSSRVDSSDDNGTSEPPAKKQKDGPKAQSGSPIVRESPDSDHDTDADVMDSGEVDSTDSEGTDEPPATEQKDGQEASSRTLIVPVDEGCHLAETHNVYIDPKGMIYDASLNQTNIGGNNNKFYRVQLLESSHGDYKTWTRWGRVGERGQSKTLGCGDLEEALGLFDKKFKEKSGNSWANRLDPPKPKKYTFIELNYEEDSSSEGGADDDLPGAGSRRASRASIGSQTDKPIKSTLAPPVQRLMEIIFNQQYIESAMAAMSYDANKLPLGKLSKRTLAAGFQALKNLAEVLSTPSLALDRHSTDFSTAVQTLTNAYYTAIPHAFGRNRPPIIGDQQAVKREVELLESLGDMGIANDIMTTTATKDSEGNVIHPLDKHYAGLKMQEMTPLKPNSNEFSLLEEYLVKSHGSTHYIQYKVQDIFRIERQGETDRFDNSPFAKVKGSDRRLLWHGSRCTNFAGILSQGLRIAPPEAPVSGYMFGKGIYLADISSKSANYCNSYSSGNIGLLLLCEAELGKPMLELVDGDSDAREVAKALGRSATWGQGRIGPMAWKDASCVNPDLKGVIMPDTSQEPGDTGLLNNSLYYNEYIAYDVAQIKLRYLLRVEMRG
ncbi:MAG: hypothetical protein M1812_003417 [Candelaria pacifica]|nr:MAG: hypothetical protein M1812_003417 [Candelaria pacifica]